MYSFHQGMCNFLEQTAYHYVQQPVGEVQFTQPLIKEPGSQVITSWDCNYDPFNLGLLPLYC